jgi:hypothetical protein
MLTKFEIGQKFPIPVPAQYRNGFMIASNGLSFDLYGFLDQPTAREKKEFKQGLFKLGVYVQDDIPFITGKFAEIEFEAPYNAHKIEQAALETWLNNKEANLVTLFLIDSATYILHGMRAVGIDFMPAVKEAMKKQIARYKDSYFVDLQINTIYRNVTIVEMIKKGHIQTFVG